MRHYFKLVWRQKYFNKSMASQSEQLYFYYNQVIDGHRADEERHLLNHQESSVRPNPRSSLSKPVVGKDPFFVSTEARQKPRLTALRFIFEVLALAICPLPFYEICIPIPYDYVASDGSIDTIIAFYRLSDFLLAFMFLRFFFLCRTIINFSIYTDAYSKKLCNSYGFISGVRFTVRCHM